VGGTGERGRSPLQNATRRGDRPRSPVMKPPTPPPPRWFGDKTGRIVGESHPHDTATLLVGGQTGGMVGDKRAEWLGINGRNGWGQNGRNGWGQNGRPFSHSDPPDGRAGNVRPYEMPTANLTDISLIKHQKPLKILAGQGARSLRGVGQRPTVLIFNL